MKPILIDTNLLRRKALCRWLAIKVQANALQVYVPTIIHAERIRQVADLYGENFALQTIRQLIQDYQFKLLELSVEDAEAVAELWLELKARAKDEKYWKQNRFDILLCAVARARGHALITDDDGEHFDLISPRKRSHELEAWLEQE
jgi:predicted nucleic acid-binding protein